MRGTSIFGVLVAITVLSNGVIADEIMITDIEADIDAVHVKIQELLDTYHTSYKQKLNMSDLLLASKEPKTEEQAKEKKSLFETIRVKALRGRIVAIVNNLNRTITHGKRSEKLFRKRTMEATTAFKAQTEEELNEQKAKVIAKVEDLQRSYKPDTLTSCITEVIREVERLLYSTLSQIGICVEGVLEALNTSLDILLCQLETATETLEYTLQALDDCDGITNLVQLGCCYESMLTGLETSVVQLVSEIISLLMQIGKLVGTISVSLMACSVPIVECFTESITSLITTLMQCVSGLF